MHNPYKVEHLINITKVSGMQRSGTEGIRARIQPSKPKWDINNITTKIQKEHMVNRVSSYFPKGGTHKVERHRNSDTKSMLRVGIVFASLDTQMIANTEFVSRQ